MKKRNLTTQIIKEYELYLKDEERSCATIKKYMRDIRAFVRFLGEDEITKQKVLQYKSALSNNYAVSSANSMLAALNSFFRFCGWGDLRVKQFKMQREAYCSKDKELTRTEYVRLLSAAKQKCNLRLNLIIQTICSTGIRVSELRNISF
ncbi:MAG: hypothetical protein E7312_04285 [Clostridiales bacterium]|nr:hypothetical protein [Clostridiales bacterium]